MRFSQLSLSSKVKVATKMAQAGLLVRLLRFFSIYPLSFRKSLVSVMTFGNSNMDLDCSKIWICNSH